MSNHADPVEFDAHLREALEMAASGTTVDECVSWLYCDAPHGCGIEPGYIGRDFYFPATLRTKRKERERDAIALRKRGWRYEAIACAVHMSVGWVGTVCRDAGLGKEWFAAQGFPREE